MSHRVALRILSIVPRRPKITAWSVLKEEGNGTMDKSNDSISDTNEKFPEKSNGISKI